MPSLSIIVPFSGSTAHLITDLSAAVQGADEVIIVDNASDEQTATALREVEKYPGGIYIRNETNIGFAAANNQGYARATGDIIMFLNSDVIGAPGWLGVVKHDVRGGALYGPSLGYQLVAGRHLPYLEGWCIAATREVWDTLRWSCSSPQGLMRKGPQIGPWDEDAFRGPYWEDNDLCLRALQSGIPLIQTRWAQDRMLAHKGGQTAGPLLRHGASFAANERTFTDRVLQTFEDRSSSPTPTWQKYMEHVGTPSDIQHHLPLLYSLAKGNVLELGTRTGVSTAALLAGVEAHGGFVWSVDTEDCGALFAGHPQWAFYRGNSICQTTTQAMAHKFIRATGDTSSPPLDLLLLDTLHTHEHVSAELAMWSSYVRPCSHILIHDPETFPGVRRAVEEFCSAKGWPVTFVLPCNGMAVIEVPCK